MFEWLKWRLFRNRILAYAYEVVSIARDTVLVKRYMIVQEKRRDATKVVKLAQSKCTTLQYPYELKWLEENDYKPMSHYVFCTHLLDNAKKYR